MKSFFRNLSTCFPFFVRRPSALERAVRQSPKSRRLGMEPLENRALLAVDAFGGAASLAVSNVEESWGPDPEPAVFSASELSTDAAETTISLAALNSVPYGPYVTSEQAALIALRSNATLADETLADFGALWDETDETTLVETATDGETLNDVAESLAFESLDLGEIEQEPLPGDASVMSGSSGSSGQNGQGDGSGDQGNAVSVEYSGGNTYSGGVVGDVAPDSIIVTEVNGRLQFTVSGNGSASVVAAFDSEEDAADFTVSYSANDSAGFFDIVVNADNKYEGDEEVTITFKLGDETLAAYTVKIIDGPEFISTEDSIDAYVVNEDYSFCYFDSSYFSQNFSEPVYVLSAYGEYPVVYSYSAGISSEDTSPRLFVLGTDDLNNIVGIHYNSYLQMSNLRYGLATYGFCVQYADDPNLGDLMSVVLQWADIPQALDVVNARCRTYIDGLSGNESCQTVANNLRDIVQATINDHENVEYAIKDLNVAAGKNPKPNGCGCESAAEHYALEVEFINGFVCYYDAFTVFEEE